MRYTRLPPSEFYPYARMRTSIALSLVLTPDLLKHPSDLIASVYRSEGAAREKRKDRGQAHKCAMLIITRRCDNIRTAKTPPEADGSADGTAIVSGYPLGLYTTRRTIHWLLCDAELPQRRVASDTTPSDRHRVDTDSGIPRPRTGGGNRVRDINAANPRGRCGTHDGILRYDGITFDSDDPATCGFPAADILRFIN